MMGTKIEVFVSVSRFSVNLYLDTSILLSGKRVQEKKAVVLFNFNGELALRVA